MLRKKEAGARRSKWGPINMLNLQKKLNYPLLSGQTLNVGPLIPKMWKRGLKKGNQLKKNILVFYNRCWFWILNLCLFAFLPFFSHRFHIFGISGPILKSQVFFTQKGVVLIFFWRLSVFNGPHFDLLALASFFLNISYFFTQIFSSSNNTTPLISK